MSFTTKYFNGPVSGTYGTLTTSGTFSASITGNANGSLSGSWSFSGTYVDTYPTAPTHGNKSISGTLTGTSYGNNLWGIDWHNPEIITIGNTLSITNGQYSLKVGMSYYIDYNVTNSAGVWNYSDLFQFQSTLGTYVLPPVISIDSYTGSVLENAGSITVTLVRSGADLGSSSSVVLSTEDGTAYAGTDYAAVNQQVVFAPGVRSVPVKLNIIRDDHTPESNKDFHLVLSSALNASLGFSSADINILESDKTDTIITSAFNYTLSPKGPNNLAFVNTSAAYSGIANFSGTGNGSANVITSGPGNDTLNGGGGNDTLTGGGGSDIFVFNTKLDGKNNVVTITDFVSGQDSLDLSKKIFSAYATVGADLTNDFVSGPGAVAHDKTDHFLYDTATGNLYYDIDGNGPKAPILFATLTGHPTLVASDLHIV